MFDVPAPLYEGMPVDRLYHLPPPSHLTPPHTPPTHYPPPLSQHMGGTVGCRTIYSGHPNGEFNITLSLINSNVGFNITLSLINSNGEFNITLSN